MRIANLGYNGKQIKYTIVDNDEVTKYTAIIGFMDSDYTVGRLTLSQFEGEGDEKVNRRVQRYFEQTNNKLINALVSIDNFKG